MSVIDQPTSASVDLVPPDRFPFLSGLDGLRAVAVMAVVFYHADFTWAQGGFLGVEVFFVISGYLITSLLLVEWLKTGTIGLKAFWVRRARRLLPAVFLLLGVVAVWSVFFLRDTLYRIGGDILASATYVTNWFFIIRNDSYFEQFGRPPLLRHLWSLSVEEQFYVMWPLIFSVGFALLGGRSKHATIRRFRWMALVGAIASTAWMAYLFVPFEDPSRVYYGTDTRASGILIGIVLATAWMPWRLPRKVSSRYKLGLNIVGWGSLAGLVVILWRMSEYDPFLYRGGILLTSILTAAVIAVIAHPAGGFGRLFSNPVMSWIGTRSYGIYLWHWPIFMVMRPGVDVPWNVPVTFAIRLTLTFVISELSYRYVEAPIRKVGYRVWMRGITKRLGVTTPRLATAVALSAFLALGSVVVVLAINAGDPPTESVVASPEGEAGSGIDNVPQSTTTTTIPVTTTTSGIAIDDDTTFTFIGDSVLLGSKEEVLAEFGENATVDATVSRQFKHADDVARELRAKGELGDVVVLHLGTNGPFNSTTFDEVMTELSDREQVYVLTIQVPRRWEATVNNAIDAGLERWPDVKEIDYYTFGKQNPDYYNDDGVHMNITGQKAYAAFLKEQIEG